MSASKYLEEHYNMNSNITLKDYLRTYYNGRELNNVDIYGVDNDTYETFVGCLSYEEVADSKYEDLKVIFINDSNIIVYIDNVDKFKELYFD